MCRDVLHQCRLRLKYVKHRPPFDGNTAEHAMEFNADVLKISMANDQYWDLMLLLDWLAAYDEMRVCVALDKLVCCELNDDMLPPKRMCGFRQRWSDLREPCGNFAMYSVHANSQTEQDMGSLCEYRCGVHIDQTGCNHSDHSHPWALFEKQDFTSFVVEDDPQQGPTKPIPMMDVTEEPTASMIANAIFQLCFCERNGALAATPTAGAAVPSTTVSATTNASVASSLSQSTGGDTSVAPDVNATDEDVQPQETPHPVSGVTNHHLEPVPHHAHAELRAFMEHLGVQYCLNSDCDIYGRPRPATHPLLSSHANAYFSDIVRCCCLSKKKEIASSVSLRGAQRGRRFFGSVARTLLELCKEGLKTTAYSKGWIAYFTSWGKTQSIIPPKGPAAATFSSPRTGGGGLAAEDSVSGHAGMPADLDDPDGDRTDNHNGAGGYGYSSCAGSQQFCFKADIMRIELHLLVHASEPSQATLAHDAASLLPGNTASPQPKSLALILSGALCGAHGVPSQPAFSLAHYSMQLSDELSDSGSVSSSGRTRTTMGSGDSHRYSPRSVEARTCILIAEIEMSEVSRSLFDIYSLERPSGMSQRSDSSNASQSQWNQCPWAENFVPPHFEERNPGECFLCIDQVQFRGHSTFEVQEAPKLSLTINPRLIVLSPVDLVVLSEFFAQPSNVVFNYERKMALKTRLREGSDAASPPTLEEPANVVSKNLVKLDMSIKLKSPRIIIPCQTPSIDRSSCCALVVDMASLTLISRYRGVP